jgi:negative regulator of flagellin synthesis FlgM
MKVNDPSNVYRLQAYRNAERVRGMKQAGSAHDGLRDGVTISPAAMEMARGSQEDAECRAERLDAVKASIQNGTYRVDLRKVAEKLYESFMR